MHGYGTTEFTCRHKVVNFEPVFNFDISKFIDRPNLTTFFLLHFE